MINRFVKIKNYRIFRDFKWHNTLDFGQYNLIFGLNGSGKSTLSCIFEDIKNKTCSDGEFSVRINDVEYNSSNLTQLNENIYVFNQNFIEQNLQEFSNLKGIVYLSDKNIGLKKKLDELKDKLKALEKTKVNADNQYNKLSKDFESTLSLGAKNIKEDFHILGGIGNQLSNYNKTVFLQDINSFNEFINKEDSLQGIKEQIEIYKSKLKDDLKPVMNMLILSRSSIDDLLQQSQLLINQDIKANTSVALSNEIFSWLEEGFKLNKDSTKCLFCGNSLNAERMKYLESIFNNTTSEFKIKIEKNIEEYSQLLNINIDINVDNFYSENQSIIRDYLLKINNDLKIFKENIEKIIKLLISKQKNPYMTIPDKIEITPLNELYNNIVKNISIVNQVIENNNQKTDTFTKSQQKDLLMLRKLLVVQNYQNLNIKKKHLELNSKGKELLELQAQTHVISQEISELESSLVDVIKAGTAFNRLLAQFLGRDEIELKFDENNKGYKIIRKENQSSAKNLSEGEKTAIAFVYFLTKVRENGNDVKNSIIVFDDPISSMDSNHIFNAYSFINAYFDNSAQLFVLTHNFTFFKLIRRHFGEEKKSKNMYFIKNNYSDIENKKVRTAQIEKLPKAILQASSEYPYLISTMIEFEKTFTNEKQAELNDYLNIANTCRKVLESFCSFKVPHLTNIFKNALQALYKCNKPENYTLTQEENLQCERIYKFVNSFSHNNSYFNDEDVNSLIGESNNVVAEILELIKNTDNNHYNGIIKQIDNL